MRVFIRMRANMISALQRAARIAKSQWTLIAAIITIIAAALNPSPGERIYKPTSTVLITALFALLGLTLDLPEMRAALVACNVHMLIQIFSLVFTPCLYYAAVFRWQWEVSAGILSQAFAVGMMAAMCMPTTTNTSVLFVQQAHGDVSLATINAALGNVLGAVLAPMLATVLINSVVAGGAERVHTNTKATLEKLGKELVLPMACGLVVRIMVQRWCLCGLRHDDDARVATRAFREH